MQTKFSQLAEKEPMRDMTDFDVTTLPPPKESKPLEPEATEPKSRFSGLGGGNRFSSLIAGDLTKRTSDLMAEIITSDKPVEEMLPEEQAKIAQQILDNTENPTDTRLAWENKLLLAHLYDLPLENVMHLEPALIKQLYGESLETGVANVKLKEDVGLMKRLIKGLVRGTVVDPLRAGLSEGPIGDMDSTIEMVRMMQEEDPSESFAKHRLEGKPRKFSLMELRQVVKEANRMAQAAKEKTRQKVYETAPGKYFDVPKAEGITEVAVESVTGITAFMGRLWATGKWFGIPRTDALGRQILTNSALVWELESQAMGGTPGKGAAMRLALAGIDKVPAKTFAGETFKTGAQSSLFGGLAYAAGGDWEDVVAASMVPLVFKSWNAVKRYKGERRLKKAIEHIRSEEFKGVDFNKVPDQLIKDFINIGQRAAELNKMRSKGKISRTEYGREMNQLKDQLFLRMEIVDKLPGVRKKPVETKTATGETVKPPAPVDVKPSDLLRLGQTPVKPIVTPTPPVTGVKPLESKQGVETTLEKHIRFSEDEVRLARAAVKRGEKGALARLKDALETQNQNIDLQKKAKSRAEGLESKQGKQPWEMTRDEFRDEVRRQGNEKRYGGESWSIDDYNKEGTEDFQLPKNIRIDDKTYSVSLGSKSKRGTSMGSSYMAYVNGPKGYFKKYSIGNDTFGKKHTRQILRGIRENEIKQALSENKPVPLSVLEEYKSEQWAKDAIAKLEPSKEAPESKQGKVKEQNFTGFAKEHGFTDDYSVLDHGQLSPSGKRSKRAHTESMRRMEERIESNKKGHEAYRQAILAGEVIDPEGKITKESLLDEQKKAKTKKIEGRLAQIDAQIRFAKSVGKGKRGIKPTAQKRIDELEAERKQLTQLEPSKEATKPLESKQGKVVRFEEGKKLTKEQKSEVLKSVGDSYKDLNAPKVTKGFDEISGDERIGYEYNPEFMYVSDITGRKIRHYITLPDGRKAHPTELYPNIKQSEVDKAIFEAQHTEKQKQARRQELIDVASKATSVQEANRIATQRNLNKSPKYKDSIVLQKGNNFIRVISESDVTVLKGEGFAEIIRAGEQLSPSKEAPTLAQKAETEEVVIKKPSDTPKAPRSPVTGQESTIDLRGKEAQVFNQAIRTQEKITAAEAGEVGIEPAGASFSDHLYTFHSYQLPATSKIPEITRMMKKVNGQRLSGKITPTEANKRIHQLRDILIQQAIKEKIALRISKKGKVKIALRESGVFVPGEVATYEKFENIEPILGGGQDITRAIQQMDGSLTVGEKLETKGQAGPIERFVLWRTREMQLQKINWIKEKTIEIRGILTAKKGSEQDKQINLVLEKIGTADRDTPIKNVLDKKTFESFSKETIKAAQELRQYYDDLIEEQNAARVMRGQGPIPYRQNYSPHVLRDTTIWEQLLMRDKTAKVLEGKDLPDYIKPNAPFNPRAMAREADMPYDLRKLSARELAESYLVTASKDIFNTSIIQNNKAFIDQLKGQGLDKTSDYLSEWTATSFAGIKPRLDRAIKLPKWAQGSLRYFNRLRNMAVFPFNVAWSLSTQPLSLSNTVGRYGYADTLKGFMQWMDPTIRQQAAKDYYSFIVKSTKRGGVTKQDASNLIGENIKTVKTTGEFIEQFSTILLTEMEKLLTGMSIRAAHIHGYRKGLRGDALKNYASDGGGKTQSMYNDEDKPMLLRGLLVKSAAPYQTYAFEVANTFREWAGKTGTPPDSRLYAMWSATRWLSAMIILRLITNRVRGKEWSWWELFPIPFREFWLSPIIEKLTGEFIPGSSGLPAPVETAKRVAHGINDVLETGNWRRLRNETLRYIPGVFKVPGGVQISRMIDAIITYSSGGLTDRKGKVLFEMEDPEDLARAIFTGVWTTKEARELLEKRKGKKKPKAATYK